MLEAFNVTKRFGALKAVDDLSFKVQQGQIFGIAGPNGAGKSTVYNLITGFYSYEGRIRFDGRDITGKPPYRIAKAGIARTFQIPQTFPSLSVQKSISVGGRFGAAGGLDSAHVDEMIRFVDLEKERFQNTALLNLLGKKKLMIGAALATKPKILMLDEPMAGCNPMEIKDLMDLIGRINRDLGRYLPQSPTESSPGASNSRYSLTSNGIASRTFLTRSAMARVSGLAFERPVYGMPLPLDTLGYFFFISSWRATILLN